MTELPIDENTPRILIVEDEPKLGQLLIDYLRAASYAPTLISHGDQVLPYVRQTPPDLILLDLMLPGTDGLTLCREIRRFSDIPIVMVTAKIEEIDRLLGLEIGADDYITKPFSMRELMARVKANIRRRDLDYGVRPKGELLQAGNLSIDPASFTVTKNGAPVELTQKEFDLLLYLIRERGRVFTREDLMQKVWNYDYFGDMRTVDVTVRRLREKIEADPGKPQYILTKRGAGYYFAP